MVVVRREIASQHGLNAERAKEVGRNPRIEEYAAEYGPSASYYAWEAAGGPVHGVRTR